MEFLGDQPVTKARTPAHGCRITFDHTSATSSPISYTQSVAPLLRQHCLKCHREGGIGPWAMDRYGRVKDYARMMEEVLATGQMPPWRETRN